MPSAVHTVYQVLKKDIRPHVKALAGVIVLTLGIVTTEAISPWPFRLIIDNVLGEDTANYTEIFHSRLALGIAVTFLFFFVNALQTILEYFHAIVLKKVIRRIIFDFSRTAFSNIELMNIGFYRTQEIGDYIYRLSNDVYALGVMLEDGVLPIITSLLFVTVTTTILFFINVKLTLLSLVALPFLVIGLYYFNEKIVRVSRRSERMNSTLYSFIQETLSQLKTIQAFSQEEHEATLFDHKMESSLMTDFKLNKLNFLLSLVVGIIIAVSYTLIIGYGITAALYGEITVGLLVVFIFYLDNLTQPILNIIYAVSLFKENKVKVERMSTFFSKSSQLRAEGSIQEITNTAISFKNVTLKSSEGAAILNNVSLEIEEHKLTVIVGVSGSGKTSVISLLPRLIDEPTKGTIFLGGKDIREYDIHTLRNSISLVSQESQLFNSTIKEVIAFGNKDCSDEDIYRAARLATADDFINRMPGKYNFKVGEAGNYLSGGQRQRLMIARALVKPAKIYIFDEPLSALDLSTRKRVWQNIKNACEGKTTIIVTNVLDVITKADNIIVMNNSSVLRSGKNIDLLNKINLYKLILRTD